MSEDVSGYIWQDTELTSAHDYLLPAVFRLLEGIVGTKRLFELGCGNGAVANQLVRRGWEVIGVDPSCQGITQANLKFPGIPLHQGSAYDHLKLKYGQFPVVLSLEVVEHVYFPRKYAATLHSLVEPGGLAIVSTPYHGYLKNLALALSGKMDAHFTALWDHGHIKFWSRQTLSTLLAEAGFVDISFLRVGRIAPLAKSMIAVARKR